MQSDLRPEGWHYRQNGQVCGPISAEQLKLLLQSGTVNPRQPVWGEDERHTMIFVQANRAVFGSQQNVA